MLNKLLQEQVQLHFGKVDQIPVEWNKLLQDISKRYNEFEKSGDDAKNPSEIKTGTIQEVNIKLEREADELKKAHNEFGRILNSVNYGFFSRNIFTNSYTYLSQGCEQIYGYTVEEFFENNSLWYDVIYSEDRVIVAKDDERLSKEEEVRTQYRIVHKDKSIRWIELTIIPFLKDGKLARVEGVVYDITERKKVETERELMMKELTKSNAHLKQFSYITSHNLRAPLSNIHAILNLFEFSEEDNHNREMLEMLKASANQLNKTIDDITRILIINNNANSDSARLDLHESFNQVMQTFIVTLNEIDATVITDFKSPFAFLNKVYLESVFINLISNAIKYHSANRKLIIRVDSCAEEAGYVTINFSDNGMGIDLARHKDKVFGLYQRFHNNIEGQGLGLFIMKSQIESAGGKILIESEPDVGTTFIITLKAE